MYSDNLAELNGERADEETFLVKKLSAFQINNWINFIQLIPYWNAYFLFLTLSPSTRYFHSKNVELVLGIFTVDYIGI